jgi:hypothetical protein
VDINNKKKMHVYQYMSWNIDYNINNKLKKSIPVLIFMVKYIFCPYIL